MPKTIILSALFLFACNWANAMADHTPRGTVTVGAPMLVLEVQDIRAGK